MGVEISWNDARRTVALRLARGSRMLAPGRRDWIVKLGQTARLVTFEGRPLELKL
jgi:hypothetical protein